MTKNNVFVCPTCGRSTTDYKHSMTKVLVMGLRRLHAVGGLARSDALGMDYSPTANFQKLQYFGLIVPTHHNNEWQITKNGEYFLQGRVQVSKWVMTRNGRKIRESDELVFIHQIQDCVQYKIEWKEQAAQPSLFD